MCLHSEFHVAMSVSIDFRIKNDVRLYLELFVGMFMLSYVICVCLRVVVPYTYCVLFLHCFSLSCVPYVASFSGLSIFDCPFGII